MRNKSLIEMRVNGTNLIGKDDILAEATLLQVMKMSKKSPIDLHFTYNGLIKLCYKYREKKKYLNRCIEYCKKDIELFTKFKTASIEEDLNRKEGLLELYDSDDKQYTELKEEIKNYKWLPPSIPSIDTLAYIYEKQEKYNKSIEVCKRALLLDLNEWQKEGLHTRISKLESKLSKKI